MVGQFYTLRPMHTIRVPILGTWLERLYQCNSADELFSYRHVVPIAESVEARNPRIIGDQDPLFGK